MNSFAVFMTFAFLTVTFAEPPSGYSYSRPIGGGGGGGISFGSHGGGISFGSHGGGISLGGGGGGGGGGYQAVSSGYQTSEGQHVDHQLLEQVRQILLREESQSSSGGHGGFHGGAPSGSYGPPAPVYGPPSYHTRVVGIDLDPTVQAIQVAQYHQQSYAPSFGGYPSGPSGGYPSGPSVPSGSYGSPY